VSVLSLPIFPFELPTKLKTNKGLGRPRLLARADEVIE